MLRLEHVSLSLARNGGPVVPVLRDVDLAVAAGETLALLGPSGSGKTSLLRLCNRLLAPSSGRVIVDGRDVAAADVVALRRSIGWVVQSGALFPHLDVARNIGLVAEVRGDARAAIDRRVDELLALVRLEPSAFRERLPAELSGGERQRVGVARALALDPPLLLLDEPFAALDPITRGELQRDFRELEALRGKTVVLVTHDVDEALLLGDRIALLRGGELQQVGPAGELLERPASRWVARFLAGAARA